MKRTILHRAETALQRRWRVRTTGSFGLGPEGIAELRARFAAWPRT
jgi:hypothetical protein